MRIRKASAAGELIVYSVAAIQSYMGYADLATKAIYMHWAPQADAAARMSAIFKRPELPAVEIGGQTGLAFALDADVRWRDKTRSEPSDLAVIGRAARWPSSLVGE